MGTIAGNGKRTKSTSSSTRRIPLSTSASSPVKAKIFVPLDEFNTKVAAKAFEMFEQRGWAHGNDVEDWLEAERFVRQSFVVKP